MTPPLTDPTTLCSYLLIENRIHSLALHKATREGMDEFMKWLAVAVDTNPTGATLLLMVDLRPEGIPPLGYALPTLRRFFDARSTSMTMRIAYLYRNSAIIGIVQAFLNTLHLPTTRHFFQDETEALAWLKSPD